VARLKARKAHSGTHKGLITAAIWAAIGASVIGVLWSQNNCLTTDTLYYKASDIPKSLTGIKIANISDINNTGLNITSKVEKLSPDVIVLSGGYYDSNGNCENTVNIVSELVQIAPVYYVYNSEDQSYEADILSETGAANLTSGTVSIENTKELDTFVIDNYGEKLYNKYCNGDELCTSYVEYIDSAIKETAGAQVRLIGLDTYDYENGASDALNDLNKVMDKESKALDIAVTGNVLNIPIISKAPVDAILTGGTYGNGYNDAEYDKGMYDVNGTKVYVSGGVGSHEGVTRIFNFPEIQCITITDGSIVERNPLKDLLNSISGTDEAIDADDGYQIYKYKKNSENNDSNNAEQ
jgi:predicted MPP superfamily phosphohydrolase